MLEVAGACRRVSATALTDGRPIEPRDAIPSPNGMGTIAGEHITATLSFSGNVTGSRLQHRFPVVDATAHSVTFYGTKGRLFWRNTEARLLPVPHEIPGNAEARWEDLPASPVPFDPATRADEADVGYVDEYVRALDEGRPHRCSGEAGRHVLEVMMGIFESAAYGRPVDLPQVDRAHPLLRWRKENGLGPPAPMARPYEAWLAEEDARLGRRQERMA
jgi:predicted dehydrogenase